MRTPRNPESIHPPVGAYSHQIAVNGQAQWLVMAGQVGQMPDGSVPPDPVEQLSVALENVQRNLEAAGMRVDDLVKITWYLVGEIDTGRRREAINRWLGDHRPCSTLVYVAALASPQYRVEVDAWACRVS